MAAPTIGARASREAWYGDRRDAQGARRGRDRPLRLEIIEQSGVEGLTMRHLSRSWAWRSGDHHHVPNKHALLVLVTNELHGRIAIPARDGDDCLGQVRQAMINLTAVMRPYPSSRHMTQHPSELPIVDLMNMVQGRWRMPGAGEPMAQAPPRSRSTSRVRS
jgi:hypothetical protein